jgi:predicted secreted protein
MTIVQFLVAYAVCWWMVLFMLLPSGADPEVRPTPGHAPSAPAKPGLRRKARHATLWAFLPALLLYLFATAAKAEEGIYTTRGDACPPATRNVPAADVAAEDGKGVGGAAVVPATLNPSPFAAELKSVDMPLRIPSTNYLNEQAYNADLRESFLEVGTLKAGMDGDVSLNGHSVNNSEILPPDCKPQEKPPEKPHE